MNAKKVNFLMVGGVIASILIMIAVLFFGIKMLSSKSSKLVSLRLTEQTLTQEEGQLNQSRADIKKYTPLNNIAETVVPQEKDQALAVREITSFASSANVNIASITFPASNLGIAVSTQSSSGSTKTSPTPPPSQLQKAPGVSGIYVLPITIQSDVTNPITYAQLITFLQELENNRHTAEVGQLTITPADPSGQHLSFSIVVNIYVK